MVILTNPIWMVKVRTFAARRTVAHQYTRGISIDEGNALVEVIKPYVCATRRTGTNGGFGGVFNLKAAGYADPLLVSNTDGVGTKLRVAIEAGIHDTVGTWPRFTLSHSGGTERGFARKTSTW